MGITEIIFGGLPSESDKPIFLKPSTFKDIGIGIEMHRTFEPDLGVATVELSIKDGVVTKVKRSCETCDNCRTHLSKVCTCTGCFHAFYCGKECQIAHRKKRKQLCNDLIAQRNNWSFCSL